MSRVYSIHTLPLKLLLRFLTEFRIDFHLGLYFSVYHHAGHKHVSQTGCSLPRLWGGKERREAPATILRVLESTADGWRMSGSSRLC